MFRSQDRVVARLLLRDDKFDQRDEPSSLWCVPIRRDGYAVPQGGSKKHIQSLRDLSFITRHAQQPDSVAAGLVQSVGLWQDHPSNE